jgi:FtsP/CotA-like multicopper oxidase with cupredoxin domain
VSAFSLSRRRVLQLAGLGAGAVAVGGAGWGIGAARSTDRLTPARTGAPLAEPPVLRSADGVLAVTLTAAVGAPLAGRSTRAFGYNGSAPGPTLRVRPGDRLRVRLVNQLAEPTNLHTHGLHVSPEGNGDNPFLSVAPGATFDYDIQLPADHPAGTFWYHPHQHPYVAEQVFSGLVGALIVEGGTELPVSRERVLVLHDTTLDGKGRVVPATSDERAAGREGDWVLVNGQLAPALSARPGAAERWRIVNASASRVLSLRLEGHAWTQVGLDGSALPAPRQADRLLLAPGNRADVVVTAGAAGSYRLVAEPYDRGTASMGSARLASATRRVELATFAVAGEPMTAAALPAALRSAPLPTAVVTRRRRLVLAELPAAAGSATAMPPMPGMAGMDAMTAGGMSFTIDGKVFDHDRVDQSVRLGDTEEWTVVNASLMDHPFHVHVWPFLVIADSSGAPLSGSLQDVVLVKAGGTATLRVHFADVTGRSVYHCHILDHEDAGMMGLVEVIK